MNALFVYTAKIFQVNGVHYTNNLPSRIWRDRYRKVFDKVTVYAREIVVDDCHEASSEYDGVQFCLTKYGVEKSELITQRSNIYREIYNLAKEADFIIARMGFFGVLAAKAARALGKPYVCEVVGSSWDDLWNYSYSGKFAACWLQPQVKYEVSKAQYAVYVTNKYLQNEYHCKGKTVGISNVILKKHDDMTLLKRLDHIMNKTENVYLLGTAAGIDVPYKGQRFVIDAIKILNSKGVKCEYLLAGNGDQNYLRSYAESIGVSDQVKFTGALPHEKMPEYFDKLDIYIQPSLQEGLPRAMIEAMARGLPAIGARTAGIPELIEERFVCRRKSVKDIVDRIIVLTNSRDMLASQAKRNFTKSFEYEKDVLEDRWLNFYLEAIHS